MFIQCYYKKKPEYQGKTCGERHMYIVPTTVLASSAHLLILKSLKFSSVLVNCGLLQCRDVGSLWLGIPGAGVFMKHFTKGRTNILRMIRRRKFKEILQQVHSNCAIFRGIVRYLHRPRSHETGFAWSRHQI